VVMIWPEPVVACRCLHICAKLLGCRESGFNHPLALGHTPAFPPDMLIAGVERRTDDPSMSHEEHGALRGEQKR